MVFTSTNIEETLIIAEGETRTFTPSSKVDNGAFWLVATPHDWWSQVSGTPRDSERAPTFPTLINRGSMIATDTATDTWGVVLLFLDPRSGTSRTVENYGLMSSYSAHGEARVISGSSWAPGIFNDGVMTAEAPESLARAVMTYSVPPGDAPTEFQWSIHNGVHGEINAYALHAEGVLAPFGNFINDGIVRAIGGNAWAVLSTGGYLENNGQVIAQSNSGGTAVAYILGIVDPFNSPRNSVLVNTGAITAATAITEMDNYGVTAQIANSGAINGAILLYDGNDTLTNTGVITGLVQLGFDDDVYSGATGTLIGTLDAGDGNDIIEVGAGASTLNGGNGTDWASVDLSAVSGAVAYTHSANALITVGGQASHRLQNIEHVELQAGSGNDTIVLGAGDDTIELGQGNGLANGGLGYDHVLIDFSDRSSAVVYTHNTTEALATVGGVTAVTVRNAERISIIGGSVADSLTGGDGDDFFRGGGGGDAINGGAGFDTASYAGSALGVTVTINGAASGGAASGDTLANIEALIGSSHADTLAGDAQDNRLDGGAGADALTGGAGHDTYVVDDAGDVVTEASLGGVDRVLSWISYALGADVEQLELVGVGDTMAWGNSLDNLMLGNAGANTFHASAGADFMDGADGEDTLSYAAATGAVDVSFATGFGFGHEAEGDQVRNFENLIGSIYDDTLVGNYLNNFIEGGLGANSIDGADGFNTAVYANSASGVTINLKTGVHLGGDAEGDTLVNIWGIIGSNFDDVLIGGNEPNWLVGGAGDDLIIATYNQNKIEGGEGYDTASYADMVGAITIDLTQGIVAGFPRFHDTVSGIERFIGTDFADLFKGDESNNDFEAGADDDILFGGAGVDKSAYAVASSAASWHRNPDGSWTVTAGAAGTDTLNTVEFLDFTDRDVFLDRAYSAFSGDGTSDVFMQHSTGAMGVWFVGPSGVTGAAGLGALDSTWDLKGVGDFNGDSKDDILMWNDNGFLGMWFMNGASVSSAAGPGAIDKASWDIEAIGDLNGDGKDDILMWHDNGSLGVWFMNGAGATGASLGGVDKAAWDVEGLADFNGDGKDDILWKDVNGNLGVWFMNGASASGAGLGNIGTSWAIEGLGDFNGDGRDDILMRHDSGSVGIWFMNGASATGVGLGTVSQDFAVAAIGDYNGDGKDDILWWHDNGSLGAWFMNGASATGIGYGGVSHDWVLNPG